MWPLRAFDVFFFSGPNIQRSHVPRGAVCLAPWAFLYVLFFFSSCAWGPIMPRGPPGFFCSRPSMICAWGPIASPGPPGFFMYLILFFAFCSVPGAPSCQRGPPGFQCTYFWFLSLLCLGSHLVTGGPWAITLFPSHFFILHFDPVSSSMENNIIPLPGIPNLLCTGLFAEALN